MKAKQSQVPQVVNTKNLSAHNVKVVQLVNPHQKMEGVQKFNKEEISKLADKAKNAGDSTSGGFVKVMLYEFHVDVVEDDEPKKIIKKDKKKDDSKDDKKEIKKDDKTELKKDLKKNGKQDKKKDIVEEDEVVDDEQVEGDQDIQEEQEIEEEQEKFEEAKPKWVDVEGVKREENEENEDDDQLENDEDILGSDAEEQEGEQQEQPEETKSQSSNANKYRSGMASLMDSMMADSLNPNVDNKKSPPQKSASVEEVFDIPDFEEQQKNYLKTIKQYQIKIKKLNQRLEQVDLNAALPIIQEEAEIVDVSNQDLKVSNQDLKASNQDLKVSSLVSDEKQKLTQQEEIIKQQQLKLEQMQLDHQQQMMQMVQQYHTQMKNMQQKVKRYESYAVQHVESSKKYESQKSQKKEYQDGLSLISSNISGIVDEKEMQSFYNDPNFNDPNLTDQIVEQTQSIHFNFDADIDMDLEEDIDVSISGVSSLSSGIDSLISNNEQIQFQQQIKKKYDQIPQVIKQNHKNIKNDSSLGSLASDIDQIGISGVSSNIDLLKTKKNNGITRFRDVDSNITDLIADDSELGFNYADLKNQQKPTQEKLKSQTHNKYEIDSDIGDLIDKNEIQDLLCDQQFNQMDSQLSISDMFSLGQVTKLIKIPKTQLKFQNIDSDIDSLISLEEQKQLLNDSQFKNIEDTLQCSNSDISSLISEQERLWMKKDELYWRMDPQKLDSQSIDMDFNYDPDGSFYKNLAQQLEKDYRIPQHDKLEIYRKIIAKAKKEYSDQLKVKINNPKTIDMNSSIGSVLSKTEQAELLNNSKYGQMGSSYASSGSSKGKPKKQQNAPMNMGSSIGSVMSKKSQEIYNHDPQFSQMDSRISGMVSQTNSKASIVQSTCSKRKNVADFLNLKKGIINDLSYIAKQNQKDQSLQEKQKAKTFQQKYQNFVEIKSRETLLRDMDSSIGGFASSIDKDSLYEMNSNISDDI